MTIRNPQALYDALPKTAKDAIDRAFPNRQLPLLFLDQEYYSRGRIQADSMVVGGSNQVTYTFLANHMITLFGYGQNGPMAPAGYSDGRVGTYADTNLQTGQETNGDVFIAESASIQFTPRSDAIMARETLEDIFVVAGFGSNTQKFKLGTPQLMPGGSTLQGGGPTTGLMPNVGDAQLLASTVAIGNGWPVEGNVRDKNDPLVWYPKAAGIDCLLSVQLIFGRQVAYTSPARAAASGIVGVTPPSTFGADGAFYDVIFKMRGAAVTPQSPSQGA